LTEGIACFRQDSDPAGPPDSQRGVGAVFAGQRFSWPVVLAAFLVVVAVIFLVAPVKVVALVGLSLTTGHALSVLLAGLALALALIATLCGRSSCLALPIADAGTGARLPPAIARSAFLNFESVLLA
jgi:hypothetical protein